MIFLQLSPVLFTFLPELSQLCLIPLLDCPFDSLELPDNVLLAFPLLLPIQLLFVFVCFLLNFGAKLEVFVLLAVIQHFELLLDLPLPLLELPVLLLESDRLVLDVIHPKFKYYLTVSSHSK